MNGWKETWMSLETFGTFPGAGGGGWGWGGGGGGSALGFGFRLGGISCHHLDVLLLTVIFFFL